MCVKNINLYVQKTDKLDKRKKCSDNYTTRLITTKNIVFVGLSPVFSSDLNL